MTNDDNTLRKDLASLADTLELTATRIRSAQPTALTSMSTDTSPLARAKHHYKGRRKRGQMFSNCGLFGEPAWDMIVDLYIAAEEGKQVSVSSLCIASAGPMTTALRWITILENAGIIERTADQNDARRFYLSLSADARDQVHFHFANFG